MEKLLNLLNEYMFVDTSVCEHLYNKDVETIYVRTTLETWEIDDERVRDERIISKKYGFIKRLVDNDKIDVESYCRITSVERKWEKDVYRDEVDSLIMLLAIQDEPIEFLISVLK
jgi:hypothetical protein